MVSTAACLAYTFDIVPMQHPPFTASFVDGVKSMDQCVKDAYGDA